MFLPLLLFVSLVNDVRVLVARHDLAAAEKTVAAYRAQAGVTPEYAAALSWVARGALDARQWDEADKLAAQTRQVTLELMRTRMLDRDPWLPVALGAAIEVHAQVLAARGQRSEAVAYLRDQFSIYRASPIGERIRKDLNLLSMVGKPAPPLEAAEWLGPRPPTLASLRGHPVLLFFWAHWCPDCKADAPALAAVLRRYGPKGLALIAPTRYYGYVAGGVDAPPAVEKQYIDQVRRQFYPMLAGVPVPISPDAFLEYGASTTPTIVLIDAGGIIRLYHPGALSEAELSAHLDRLVAK